MFPWIQKLSYVNTLDSLPLFITNSYEAKQFTLCNHKEPFTCSDDLSLSEMEALDLGEFNVEQRKLAGW